jgi:hypothetical protein
MPQQVRDAFHLTAFDQALQVTEFHAENLGGFGVGVGILRIEEEEADVRGCFGHGMISCV